MMMPNEPSRRTRETRKLAKGEASPNVSAIEFDSTYTVHVYNVYRCIYTSRYIVIDVDGRKKGNTSCFFKAVTIPSS